MSLGLHLPVLGLTVVEAPDGMTVKMLDHGGAAEKSEQVRSGDILTSINDIGIDDKDLDEITRLSTSVDHRGLTKISLLKQDGSQSIVVLDVQGSVVQDGEASVATDAVGVGISIAIEEGKPVVADLTAWGSARWSGKIGVGDEVVSVHTTNVASMTPAEIIKLVEEPSIDADGGIVKIAVRRKGAVSNATAPTVVLLARSIPNGDKKRPQRTVLLDETVENRRHAVPDGLVQAEARVPSKQEGRNVMSANLSSGADAWNPVSWLGQARTLLGEQSSPQFDSKSKPESEIRGPEQPELNSDASLDLNQSALLTAILEELLSSVQEGSGRLEGPVLQQASSLPECTYDVSLVLKLSNAIQGAFRGYNRELRNAHQIISLSQENMDKRKQHILQLSAQLKATEEKHHKDLRSNNDWMEHELKKEKGALQVVSKLTRCNG